MERALRIEMVYPHSPAKVWHVLTTSEYIAQWLMPNDFAPKLGHKFQFRTKPRGKWDGIVNCEILEIIPERKLVFTWTSNMLDTRVTFLLEPVGTGTRLTLLHTGFSGFQPWLLSFLLGSGWKRHILKTVPVLISRLEQSGSL